jgi:hypothetical protein
VDDAGVTDRRRTVLADQHEPRAAALQLGQPCGDERNLGGAGADERVVAAAAAIPQFGAREAAGHGVTDPRHA